MFEMISNLLSQMAELDLFKEILSDVGLYQNSKSTYLSYFSITSFNMNTVTPIHVCTLACIP